MIEEKIFSEYGRKKLLMYADSFQELADSFEEEFISQRDNREQQIRDQSFRETMHVLKDNLWEVSHILKKVAQETAFYRRLPDRQTKRIVRMMGKERILVKDIYYIEEKSSGKKTLNVTMRTDKTGGLMAADVADMLSVILDKRLTLTTQSLGLVDHQARDFFFQEDPQFMVLTGYARAIREQEKVSGDNYSVIELDGGRLVVLLSDGMGSGEKACKESISVIERMETLLEAGHTVDRAINIVNNTLLAAGEPVNMSTLDVCSIDLHTGKCEFRKMGAAASFIKSNIFVEPISMNRLPLGIFFKNDDDAVYRELMDNDYLIMVTDGVLDAFGTGGYEEMLIQYLKDMRECSPAEVAQRVLQFALKCSGGHVKDDMTILVLEVFQSR